MVRAVIIYVFNLAIWFLLSLQFFGRNDFNILLAASGIAVGAIIGFLGVSWRLKPLSSKGELIGSRKDLVIPAAVIVAGVYLFIYPGPLAALTATTGFRSLLSAMVPSGWGGYVFALLWWEHTHGMDIVTEGNWTVRAVPKPNRQLNQ